MAGSEVKVEIGQVLEGRYVLERVIGEGGMGVVFAARHVELDEVVAIKVLHDASALEEEHLGRFLREARLAAKIKNDHVVRVIDVERGSLDGETPPYIVMEYLEGFDLADLLRARGPLPAMEAVDYVLQACEAVVEAHALGIIHRDLKPSNLHLTRRSDGSPLLKVLDFGISKTHDDQDSKLTTTSSVFGSPAYMSPEQIRSSKHVDQRTDVWALAIVLFELITGRLPFLGDSAAAILAAVAADPPLSLSQYARHPVPPGLELALEQALIKDRERRVSGIPELAQVLAPFASTPAGQASVDAIRRCSSSYRQSTSLAAPLSPRVPNSAENPIVRTDRGMVVASRRSLASRTNILAGIALTSVVALIFVTTWAVRNQRHGNGAAAARAPEDTSIETAAPTPTVATVASNNSDTAFELPPTTPSSSRAGAHGTRRGHSPAGPRASSSSATVYTPSSAASPAPKPPSNGIDTDSRH